MIILNKEKESEFDAKTALKMMAEYEVPVQMKALEALRKLGSISKRRSEFFVISRSLFMSERYLLTFHKVYSKRFIANARKTLHSLKEEQPFDPFLKKGQMGCILDLYSSGKVCYNISNYTCS